MIHKQTFYYEPIVKDQKDNPFYRMTTISEHDLLQRELASRLYWISELSASRDAKDREVFSALTTPDKIFGRAPLWNNANNTALSSLAGAVDKLSRGDLSKKQIENITPTLGILHSQYPKIWGEIVFAERSQSQHNEFDQLFDHQ